MTPEEVRAALKHKCDLCGAAIGADCISIIDGKSLPFERPVHYYRERDWEEFNKAWEAGA